MTQALLYMLCGIGLFAVGLFGVLARRHLVRRVVAINIMGGGVLLVLGAAGARGGVTDPVPQALVITGIVVAVATTALALALVLRLFEATGEIALDETRPPDRHRRG